ncbi:MAG: sodium:alanine symporter family protein [Oscillospiraceae bacterium]|nr:sodium:alanine symporter family protein [Oscillospiraceae bacterium]
MTLSEFITKLDDVAWGSVVLCLLVGVGVVLSICTRFLQFRKFGHAMKMTLGRVFKKTEAKAGEVTPLQALTTALAGTVGTGNIAGVTGAIVIGGPGAVFWMWISALVGMMTKFCEVTLAVHYRERNDKGDWVGGPMYYIKNGLGKGWGWLGVLFCIFGALAAFGIGNATQVQSITGAINGAIDSLGGNTAATQLTFLGSTFSLSSLIIGVVVAILIALVLFGGIKRIGSVTERVVPVMAVVYIIASLIIIFANITHIGRAFGMIFQGAFSAEAALGAAFGITIKTSITKGIARGCFSNEAGLGSAPMAHAATSEKDPVKQGFFGIFEVFMDTIIICTLTSLVVLTTVAAAGAEGVGIAWGTSGGASIVTACMARIISGGVSGVLVAVCLSLFAFSTILSWSLYGTRCFEFLFGTKASKVYQIIFVLFAIVGATMSLADAWNLADALNGFMAIPNLISILALSPVVIKLVREYFENKKQERLS